MAWLVAVVIVIVSASGFLYFYQRSLDVLTGAVSVRIYPPQCKVCRGKGGARARRTGDERAYAIWGFAGWAGAVGG